MADESYSLEFLVKKFSEDMTRYEDEKKKQIKLFKEKYPSEKLPPHYADGFSLPKALCAICYELIRLRDKK